MDRTDLAWTKKKRDGETDAGHECMIYVKTRGTKEGILGIR